MHVRDKSHPHPSHIKTRRQFLKNHIARNFGTARSNTSIEQAKSLRRQSSNRHGHALSPGNNLHSRHHTKRQKNHPSQTSKEDKIRIIQVRVKTDHTNEKRHPRTKFPHWVNTRGQYPSAMQEVGAWMLISIDMLDTLEVRHWSIIEMRRYDTKAATEWWHELTLLYS